MSRFFHSNYDKTWGTVIWAKEKDPVGKIQSMLKDGAKINATSAEGSSVLLDILHEKAEGWKEAALFLIEHGARVNQSGKDGETALIRASRAKDGLEVVKALVNKGARINHQSKHRFRGNRPPIASSFALKAAVFHGNEDIADFLLASGANVHLKDSKGCEAIACLQANDENFGILKKLVEAGADVNASLWGGDTPLMSSAANGSMKSFKYLLGKGADINKVAKPYSYDSNGNFDEVYVPQRTPLSVAVDFGHFEIAKFAMDNGAEVDDNVLKRLEENPEHDNCRRHIQEEKIDPLEIKAALIRTKAKSKAGKTADVSTGTISEEHRQTAKEQTKIAKKVMKTFREIDGK